MSDALLDAFNPHPVELQHAPLIINHGPVTIVSTAHEGRDNLLAVSWVMPLGMKPPRVGIMVGKHAFSRQMIEDSGEFVVNVPARAFAERVIRTGSRSGRDGDKFAALGIDRKPGSLVKAPLVSGCVGWLECRLIPEPGTQERYDLLIGEVVAAWADPRVFNAGIWRFGDEALRTVHYSTGGHFYPTGDAFIIT